MPIYKTDEKKDGKQQYVVKVNYTDKNGNHKQIKRITYGNAEAKLLEKQLLDETKVDIDTSFRTVQSLYDEYMITMKNEIRLSTWEKKGRMFRNRILPDLGKYRLDKINTSILQDWKNQLSEDGLQIGTLKTYYKEVNALFNYAVKMRYLPLNPVKFIGNFKEVYFETSQDKLHYYTKEEFLKYIKEAKQSIKTLTDWDYYVFFCIAFYTGMRKGEIHALKWSDIDGNIIHIRRSVCQKVKGGDLETPPKNKSSYRDLQMPQPLITVLTEHKARQKEVKEYIDDLRICGGEKCLRDTTLEKKNTAFAKAAELPHIKIHDFRHTHASLLVNEGINIQEIARRLGHTNVEITWKIYSHLYPREEERAVNVLNSIELI